MVISRYKCININIVLLKNFFLINIIKKILNHIAIINLLKLNEHLTKKLNRLRRTKKSRNRDLRRRGKNIKTTRGTNKFWCRLNWRGRKKNRRKKYRYKNKKYK